MSREIKFRVYDKYNEEYLDIFKGMNDGLVGVTADGDNILCLEDGQIQKYRVYDKAVYDDNGEEIFNKEDVYIVEQYTGLKDENGKEIYEGDIVKEYWRNNPIGAVIYGEHNCSCCHSVYGFAMVDADGELLQNMTWSEIEVIGNVHKNPELLDKNTKV